MRSGNPALKESTFLDLGSGTVVSRDGGAMTLNGTVNKTGLLLLLAVITGAYAWSQMEITEAGVSGMGYVWGGAIAGFVLAMVTIFKKEWAPVSAPLYALAEGLFLGGISQVFEQMWPGIAVQAVLATFCVFAVTLALFASGKWRVSAKSVKIFMIAMIGYALFSLVNLFLMLFGVTDAMFGLRGEFPLLGLGIGVLAVFLAAFSLVMDFTAITEGVKAGAPQKYSWSAAFGLTVTLVWLYVEILRILAILRGND